MHLTIRTWAAVYARTALRSGVPLPAGRSCRAAARHRSLTRA
jgi:hypothetical protein